MSTAMTKPQASAAAGNLPATNRSLTISTFRNRFDNKPVKQTMGHDQLVKALTTHQRRRTKDGPMFSAASFKPGKTRANANVECVNILVGEFDHSDYEHIKSHLDSLGYEHIIYSSFSSTPEAPRFRVVVFLTRTVALAEFAEFKRRADYWIFKNQSDPGTKDPARMYYFPSCPPDALCFAGHYEGRLLDATELAPVPGSNGAFENKSPIPETIPNGEKHQALIRLFGAMRAVGANADEMYAAGLAMKAGRFQEFVSDEDIRKRAESVEGLYAPNPRLNLRDTESEAKTPAPYSFQQWTHDELLAKEFTEQRWVIEGLVPQDGLTILGGKKKAGKSWLALQMAQAVASGTTALGRKAQRGKVIYLCLEDGERRIQGRLKKQKSVTGLQITYITRFDPLDGTGMAQLEALIEQAQPLLVIIDTLAASKSGKVDENSAGVMADLTNDLRELAQDRNTAIVVVAHHGKGTYGDPGDDIRGSSAIAAAADMNIGIYKVEGSTAKTLKAEGRDIEELELRIEFDKADTWGWVLVGDARQLAKEEVDQETLDALAQLGEGDASTVGREMNKSRPAARAALKRLHASGQIVCEVVKVGRSTKLVYRLAPKRQ